VRVRRSSATRRRRRITAFNDVVAARVPGFGTARLRVDIDGQAMLALAGDGVVIASPTGSTAYTLGAGGPAVAPTLDAIVLTPLASQGSPLRSLVVDGTDTVRVTREPSSAPLSIEVDGRTTVEVPASASLKVRAAPRKARWYGRDRVRSTPTSPTAFDGCETARSGHTTLTAHVVIHHAIEQ
jgi:NAD kinase